MPTYRVRVIKTRTVTERFDQVVDLYAPSLAGIEAAAERHTPAGSSWVRGTVTLPTLAPITQIEAVPATPVPAAHFRSGDPAYNARRGPAATGAEGMPVAVVETRSGYTSSRSRRTPSN